MEVSALTLDQSQGTGWEAQTRTHENSLLT